MADVLVPDGDRRATAAVLRAVPRAAGADYAIRLGGGAPAAIRRHGSTRSNGTGVRRSNDRGTKRR